MLALILFTVPRGPAAGGSTGSFRPRAAVAAGLVPESGTKIVKHESDCKKPARFYRSRFEHPVAPVKGGA